MAALEDYANLRYGVDTSLLWSRIEKVIPKTQRAEVAASQIAMQALLNCSTALTLASAAELVLPRLHNRPATAPAAVGPCAAWSWEERTISSPDRIPEANEAAALYSLIGSAKLNGLDSGALSSHRAQPHRRASHQSHY